MVCVREHHTEALLEFTHFHCETVVECLISGYALPYPINVSIELKKLHTNVCSIVRTTKQRKGHFTMYFGIIIVVANLVIRWKHSYAENVFYKYIE